VRRIRFHPRIATRIAELNAQGADTALLRVFEERLRSGRRLGKAFNDHSLTGKLSGLRSAVVGHTAGGIPIVAVYQSARAWAAVALVEEHDLAYVVLRREKRPRRAGGS
jgi:mRNA-degrading endonuclease YafQ of YafQ-DinJ toxin-antitoxin module